MNNAMFKGILLASLGLAVTACSESDGPGLGKAFGRISPVAELNSNVTSSRPSRLEYTDITVDSLSVRLTSDDGSFSQTWDKLADFPVNQDFNVGDYTLEVFYGDENTEGFEYPRFYGSQAVKVRENETSTVAVTAAVDNALVSIDYSENFTGYMTSWSSELHAPGGEYVTYAQDESRPAYVKPGEVEIYVDYVKPNGKGAKIKAASFTALAAHHYYVSMDLTDGAGDATLTIKFDEATEEEPVTIELSDELESAPAPELTLSGATADEPIYIVPGYVTASDINLNVIARGGLGAVKMTTQSASLTAQGWPAEIDLLQATSAQQATLASLGFEARGLFSNPDKMAVLQLGKVLSHINLSNTNNTSTFIFLVEDKQGKASESASFSVIAEALTLRLSNPDDLFEGATDLSLDVYDNAGNPESNLKIQYYNSDLGLWRDLTATYTATGERGLYRAALTVPGTNDDLKLRAKVGNTTSEELTIKRVSVVVSPTVATNEAYATSVNIDCSYLVQGRSSSSDALENLLSIATVMVSTDGSNYTAAKTTHVAGTSYLTASGLTAGTNYTAKIKIGSKDYADAETVSFTTESTAQLPNSDMEGTVSSSKISNYCNLYTFPDGWGTNNTMTTSQPQSSITGYAYKAISGTIQTDDGHNGKAALIRTVGWGSDNTAPAYTGGSSTCKYRDPGLLHLGAERTARPSGYGADDNGGCGPITTSDLDCGIAFTSRPKAMSFWYKYTAKNSNDAGEAEISLLDASGNVIASGKASLGASSSYVQKTITLTYAHGSAKAAKIYVKFLSTADAQFLTKSTTNFDYPPNRNLSDGTYMGSQLYIDDIELTY